MAYIQKFALSGNLGAGWQTWDLSGEGVSEGDVVEIIGYHMITDASQRLGVHTWPGGQARSMLIHEAEGGGRNTIRMTALYGSAGIQVWDSDGSYVFYRLAGYWDSGSYTEVGPTAYTLTSNDTWTAKTLSVVPANSVAEIVLVNENSGTEALLGAREVGSGLARMFNVHEAEASDRSVLTLFVKTDSSQQVELYTDDYKDTLFVVIGYWSTDPGTWTEKYYAIPDNSSPNTWEDEDLSAQITDGAVLEIVARNSADGINLFVGMRKNGSSDERRIILDEAEGGGENYWSAHVESDSSGVIELYQGDGFPPYASGQYLTGQWVMAGDVTVTPNPVSAIASALIGAIILGSMAFAPNPAAAIGTTVDPTVVKGSLALAPGPVTAIAATVDPGVVLGSVVVTPNPATAIGSTVDPTVVLPSMTVAPGPAFAVGRSIDPTVILGSISLTPSPAAVLGAVVDPTVVLSSVMVSPAPSTAVGATIDPVVLTGGVTITPDPASAVAVTVNPTVVLGSISLTPSPAAVLGAVVDPTVVLSSVMISPAPSTAVGATVDPVVLTGDVTITPDPASAVAVTVNPTVILGSISLAPSPVSAVGATINPTVVLGSTATSPEPAAGVAATVNPTVILGPLAVSPSPAAAVASIVDPTVVLGSISVSPAPVSAVAATVDPSVVIGAAGVTVAPAPASAVAATVNPTVKTKTASRRLGYGIRKVTWS